MTVVVATQPNQLKLLPGEDRVRVLVRTTIEHAGKPGGEVYIKSGDDAYIKDRKESQPRRTSSYLRLVSWVRTRGPIYASTFFNNHGGECDGIWLVVAEGKDNKYRLATFSIDRSLGIVYSFSLEEYYIPLDIHAPRLNRPFTKEQIEERLTDYHKTSFVRYGPI